FAAAGDVRHAVRAPPAAGAAGRSRCARLDAGGDGGRRDMSVRDAYFVAALRTPVGRHGGALAPVRPDDLAAAVLSEIVERAGVPGRDISDVVLGCANQAGEDNRNVARMAALLAGYPVSVPGVTVNRLCGSGLDAVAQAARGVKLGEGELYVGGGVESMSRAPWALPKPEKGYATGSTTVYDTSLGWRFVNPRMAEEYGTESMGETAENLAEERDVSRDEQDAYALASHRKATAAIAADRFAEEIVPVRVVSRRQTTVVATDEGPRTDPSMESLGRLRPAFREGGTVTAGNSSTLNDGAASVLVASREYAEAHGLTPLARVVSTSVVGVPPRI